MRVWGCAAAVGVLAVAAAPALADVQQFAIVQEIAHDAHAPLERGDRFLDSSFYVVWPRTHCILTLGSFATGAEWGGYLRDARGSTYIAALRRRQGGFLHDTTLEFQTAQRFERWVAGGGVRFFWPDSPETDNLLVVPAGDLQWYYRSESFLSLHAVYDPRPHTGTTVRIANRLTRGNAYLDVAIAPRSDGVVNGSILARWGHVLAGYSREHDFDFTHLDRRVWSLGFRFDFDAPRQAEHP